MKTAFDVNIYYLHPCARTSVYHMYDEMVKSSVPVVEQLLSTAAQLQMCEYDIDLYRNLNHAEHPWVTWMCESVEHYVWVKSYYLTLCEVMKNIFQKDIKSWRFINAINEAEEYFPNQVWVDPPLYMPDNCQIAEDTTYSAYRNFYLIYKVRIGCYRRMHMPFWISKRYESDLSPVVPPEKSLSDTAYIRDLVLDDRDS